MARQIPDPPPELEMDEVKLAGERKYCRDIAQAFVIRDVRGSAESVIVDELTMKLLDERRFAHNEVAKKMRARIAELEAEVARLSHVPTDAELELTEDQREVEDVYCEEAGDQAFAELHAAGYMVPALDADGVVARNARRFLQNLVDRERGRARHDVAVELRKVRGTLQGIANEYAKILTVDPRVQNYAEITYLRADDGTRFALTLRRVDGLTPSELLGERDTEWRAAVLALYELELVGPRRSLAAMKADLFEATDEELSGDGHYSRSVFRRIQNLLDEPMPAASVAAKDGHTL